MYSIAAASPLIIQLKMSVAYSEMIKLTTRDVVKILRTKLYISGSFETEAAISEIEEALKAYDDETRLTVCRQKARGT
jgi:hypothetical protein